MTVDDDYKFRDGKAIRTVSYVPVTYLFLVNVFFLFFFLDILTANFHCK